MTAFRLACGYLVAQGVAGLTWWMLLLVDSPVRDLFFASEDAWLAARTILLADIAMFGVLSMVAGLFAPRNHRWARQISWALVGATVYATLVAVGWLMEPIDHWLGAALMAPTCAATFASVVTIDRRLSTRAMIR